MDNKVTISQLKLLFEETGRVRKWIGTPRDLAISVSIESAELLEHFQWGPVVKNKEDLALEIADVCFYLFELSRVLDIDISDAINKKIVKINQKYPVDKILKYGEDFYNQQKKNTGKIN
ncbi:hypothetical protein A2872_01085 [Candidatus Gottesmanbacteria bacterium RIFCSPHIGHO2_01_FULL_42_12]|uniref:Nucleotide pyrophosphohydrolase n=1 Tax=Candidatus Gottesmanbacteria bacterium RIFCSPHIGHO2_01_FULL_42_12 TaxID=1798377 RepID=A0A1F5Z311_9BACT|nr:MAG: hypothetical protein A2872_01085 [Candidatus Gottesmanbacteria bacterium RIFCSPHIGHO2_01_FULL_42_12]